MSKRETGGLKFGDRVQIMLDKKGMSQRELAEAAHITEVSASRYISNSRYPRAPIIVDIAKALGCTTDFLLGTEVRPTNNPCGSCPNDGDCSACTFF